MYLSELKLYGGRRGTFQHEFIAVVPVSSAAVDERSKLTNVAMDICVLHCNAASLLFIIPTTIITVNHPGGNGSCIENEKQMITNG